MQTVQSSTDVATVERDEARLVFNSTKCTWKVLTSTDRKLESKYIKLVYIMHSSCRIQTIVQIDGILNSYKKVA